MNARNAEELPHVEPVLPKKKGLPFDDPDWLFELKYDGFRGVLYRERNLVRVVSKVDRHPWQFDEVEKFLSHCLPRESAILDGEVVSLDAAGRPIFEDLLVKSRKGVLAYMAFDILWLDRKDLRDLPLRERRKALHKFAERAKGCIRTAFGTIGNGVDLFDSVKENDLEGIVAKRLESPYTSRTQWYKILNPDYSQKQHRSFAR